MAEIAAGEHELCKHMWVCGVSWTSLPSDFDVKLILCCVDAEARGGWCLRGVFCAPWTLLSVV